MECTPHNIGILGGGSAGYMAALYLKRSLPTAAITLVESSHIPVIGVGEATTPLLLHFLHTKLGFPVEEFHRATRPTLKLGIRFAWGKEDSNYHFNSTFGRADLEPAMFYTGDFNNLSFPSMLMEENKAPFIRNGDTLRAIHPLRDYAYHIDNRHFLAYLKRKMLEAGCVLMDADVSGVEMSKDGKTIHSLRTSAGHSLVCDLYIDCSGFRSLLLGAAMGEPWVDYSSSLRTTRAVLGSKPNGNEIEPYTTATTMKNGWLWNTPMQTEDHLGYVFSSDHCSDDEALNELRLHCATVQDERVIHFRTGRHRCSWSGNVVGLGNAFAFIEPLQSTGLHMILRQLRSLEQVLSLRANTSREAYNETTNRSWDYLRWFVGMHFRFNGRLDTPFWRMCRSDINVDGLKDYLDVYMPHGPVTACGNDAVCRAMQIDDIFSVFAHDAILTGCGVQADLFQRREPADGKDWPVQFQMRQQLRRQCVGHREALGHLAARPFLQTYPNET